MRGAGGVRRHGIYVRSSFVKIMSYCILNASAFSLPVVIYLPSTLSTAIRVMSLRFCSDVRPEFLAYFEFGIIVFSICVKDTLNEFIVAFD